MRFLFIVQGEGRGHMTQAIAFAHLLRTQGHDLVGVIVGKSQRRTVPEFFIRELQSPIHPVESPNFETDGAHKQILLRKTLVKNFQKLPTFWKSLHQIHQIVKVAEPDVILNFYDLLGGFYNFLFLPKAQFWVVGHQYLIEHPDFQFAKGRPLEKFLFQVNTHLTALGAKEKLALSFLPQRATQRKLKVVPPLLRKEVKNLTPTEGDFYLAYMVNPGYGEEVLNFAKKHPEWRIKAYWDKKDASEIEHPLPNLSFHRVNDQTFLQDMAACKGLVCTAGFESVCEAMYLRKPVMIIPVAGQYEQACNALDAEASGVGIASSDFDFAKLDRLQKKDTEASLVYHEWINSWPKILEGLTSKTRESKPSNLPEQEIRNSPAFG